MSSSGPVYLNISNNEAAVMRKTPSPFVTASKKQTSFTYRVRPALSLLAVCALSSCSGIQSVLDPHGPQARVIAHISWLMFWAAAAILLLVMALALYAIYRAPGKGPALKENTLIVAGGVVLPVLALTALLVYGIVSMGSLRAPPSKIAAQIDVVANRWWWDVHYRDEHGRWVTTANEIRIPAGMPVMLTLRTNDVIHSFWVPNLAGKIDLVPGRANQLVLQADKPGLFRGQCAEFCGAQHARMAFHVIAEPHDDHARWLERQRAPARVPGNALLVRGQAAFSSHCLSCHTVRGVGAARERGPDLTHVASRKFLAAGTLVNNRANLLAFIAKSQQIKPGSGMPSHEHLGQDSLQAIASYLESLD